MSSLKDLYNWLHKRIPPEVRSRLKSYGLKRITERWNPRNDPQYAWPLPGVLQGHHMRFRRPEDFQFLGLPYEPDVCSAILRLIKPSWSCVDVGAHIGYFTLLMCKLVGPGGRVFAFEAVPENAKLVGENVALNGYDGLAKVENLAVSDGLQRQIALYRGPSSFEATIMLRGWEVMMEIPAVALDDYFQPGERIDFIKMDIEGGEVKALPGMARILKETRPLLLIEIHDIGLPAVDFLLKIGYRFQDLNRRALDDSEVARGLFNHCIATPPEK